jgi:putative exporter of polyketide antibiotics
MVAANGMPPWAGGRTPPLQVGNPPTARKARRRTAVRWTVHGLLFVALAVGVFGLLPRIGGLAHGAGGLRHARLAFVVAAVFAPARWLISTSGCARTPLERPIPAATAREMIP